MRTVHNYLEYSRIMLADITGLNANIFYELGVRHRTGKAATVIFRQGESLIPFDISEYKAFPYFHKSKQEAKQSRALIRRVLEEILCNPRWSYVLRDTGGTADE